MQVFIPIFSVHYVFLTNAGNSLPIGGSQGDLAVICCKDLSDMDQNVLRSFATKYISV